MQCSKKILFDHLVGDGKQRRRHVQAERLSGFKIDYQFELGRLFDRQFRRIGPFENLV